MPHEHQLHNVILRIPGEGLAVTPSVVEESRRSNGRKPVWIVRVNVPESRDLSTSGFALRSR